MNRCSLGTHTVKFALCGQSATKLKTSEVKNEDLGSVCQHDSYRSRVPFFPGGELARTHQLTGFHFVFYHFLFGFFCFVSLSPSNFCV